MGRAIWLAREVVLASAGPLSAWYGAGAGRVGERVVEAEPSDPTSLWFEGNRSSTPGRFCRESLRGGGAALFMLELMLARLLQLYSAAAGRHLNNLVRLNPLGQVLSSAATSFVHFQANEFVLDNSNDSWRLICNRVAVVIAFHM